MLFFSNPSNWTNILNSFFSFSFPQTESVCKGKKERQQAEKNQLNTYPINGDLILNNFKNKKKKNKRTNWKKKKNIQVLKTRRSPTHKFFSVFFVVVVSRRFLRWAAVHLTSMRSRSIHCVHTDWNQMDCYYFVIRGDFTYWDVCVRAIIIELNAHWSVISPINKEFKREFNRWSESKHFYGWKEEQVEFGKKNNKGTEIKFIFVPSFFALPFVWPTNKHGI